MFRFLTAGESHGQALTIVVEGVPAGLSLSEEYIAGHLARRQQGFGRGGRMQIERDRARILSGVRHGLTLGSPIGLLIENRDWANWQQAMSTSPVAEPFDSAQDRPVEPVTRVRPGHADLSGAIKYGHTDVRNVLERASARETAARVAAGAIARRLIEECGIAIHSHVLAIGGVWASPEDLDWEAIEKSPVRCADPRASQEMVQAIEAARDAGDTLGGVFEAIAAGVPIGLGSHVHWDRRLDGRIAQAFMSIPAIKGVEIGDGFRQTGMRGSHVHDLFDPQPGHPWARATNRAGGVEGGISNGEPIVVRAAVKPIPTLGNPLPSVDLLTGQPVQAHHERSDVCVVPAAGVVGEAALALVLAEAFLEKFGGDNIEETRRNHKAYTDSVASRGI
ncbi:MAG: chorismate synthase [Chloroflexi bacterium]|nr:chorismate synthase [Chloroflexota bacterium]